MQSCWLGVCVGLCVCVCKGVRVCVCAHVYMCVHACTRGCTLCTRMFACACMYVRVYMCRCACPCVHACGCARAHAYMRVYTVHPGMYVYMWVMCTYPR